MKYLSKAMVAAFAAIPLFSTAAPVTYDFTTPNWNFNGSPTLFGTGLNLSITVESASGATIDTNYQFSNILSVKATAIGGTFSDVFTTTESIDDKFVITVDANSVAMLRLAYQGTTGSGGKWKGTGTGGAFFQMGQTVESGGGYTPLYISAATFETAAYNVGPYGESLMLFGKVASGASEPSGGTVPEPAALALIGTALVFAARRSRREPQRA